MITRLVDQKGIDLLTRVLDEMLYSGMQVIVLGTGDPYYEDSLRRMADHRPDQLSIISVMMMNLLVKFIQVVICS